MKMGEIIKAYRQKYDISMDSLAKELRINKSAICRIENGKTLKLETFRKLFNWMLT